MLTMTTQRLIIRDHIVEDLFSMHQLLSSNKEMFYLPEIKTKTIEDTNQNLQVAINEANSNNRSKFFFAVIDKNTGDYIGEIGFTRKSQSEFGNVLELGYFIKEVYWGRGIIPEASKAIISYAFKNLNTRKIVTGCVVNNSASERVMKKLGMIKEAEFKNHVILANKLYDRVEYRMLKEEWEV